MSEIKAVLLDKTSMAPEDLDFSAWGDLNLNLIEYNLTSKSEVLSRVQNAEIVITNKVPLNALTLSRMTRTKLIVLLATGTNNVDLQAAKDHKIAVCNMVDYSTESVAQHTLAVLLAMTSRLFENQKLVQSGAWVKSPFFGLLDYPLIEVRNMTLGIIGYGAIGQRVAELASAFGIKVLVSKSLAKSKTLPQKDRASFTDLLKQSDVISLHCPLTAETENLITKDEISLMKKGSFLINTARGGLVNEIDLVAALKKGHLAGAAMDVLTQEPPQSDHCLLADDVPNLIVTPHSAWSSQRSRQTAINQVTKILQAYYDSRENGSEVNIQRVV